MEWTVVTVLVALAGLLATVGKPVLRLNASITRLTLLLESLTRRMDEADARALERTRRLWAKNDEQDELLHDHEQRLGRLEGVHGP